jgi:amino acid permease (GABA permease)
MSTTIQGSLELPIRENAGIIMTPGSERVAASETADTGIIMTPGNERVAASETADTGIVMTPGNERVAASETADTGIVMTPGNERVAASETADTGIVMTPGNERVAASETADTGIIMTSGNEMVAASDTADTKLAAMGYKAELPRSLSFFSVLGLSFAIMGVPYGESVTLSIGLTSGGPVTILYGWILVTIISVCIAASLAEICSAYPTSGGVYYWSAMLANKKWAPIAAWTTGWVGLVGNWTLNTAICFSGAQIILSAIGLWNEAYIPEAWHVLLTYWAMLLIALFTNIFAAKHLSFINTMCVFWTSASVVIILVTVLTMAKAGRRSAAYVFTEFDATRAGWTPGWAFFVGLLQPAFTLTGYGMVAAMCEEVQNPEREVPKAMVLSVVAAGITGVIYLIPILFVMPDVDKLLAVATGQPIGYLFMAATGSPGGGFGLLSLLLGIEFFAAIGSLTASSRCLYAFSRDGAVPGSIIWSKINKRFNIPLNALLLSTLIQGLLGLIYLGSSAAFNAFTGVATICLSASYAIPVFILLIRGRHLLEKAPFHLGKFGYVINIITILWILFAIVLFTMPTVIPVTPSSMNYASVLFVFFAGVSVLWYGVSGRKHFTGPTVPSLKKSPERGVLSNVIVGGVSKDHYY